MTVRHEILPVNGIDLHIATAGDGPLVVLCHGFPGLWYSWRHQLPALAEAGYRAVAVDQRGYGQSSRPTAVDDYTSTVICNDMLGLLDALGEEQAVFVGHDFGAPLVWNLAVRHADRVRGVVAVACPYDFDVAGRGGMGSNPPPRDPDAPLGMINAGMRPSESFTALAQNHFIHLHYFQQIGPAEAELGGRVREFLTRLFWALSAKGKLLDWSSYPSTGTGYLDALAAAGQSLPWPWLSEADMDYYVNEYERLGPDLAFVGGLHSYRVADRNWEIGLPWADSLVEVPAMFVSGKQDPTLTIVGEHALSVMQRTVPSMRAVELIDSAGHFVQQEQAAAFNLALLGFLKGLA